MKTIGRTNEGNYLVEMNTEEHLALARLSAVSGGAGWYSLAFDSRDLSVEIDLSTPLAMVTTYSESLAYANDLANHVKRVMQTLTLKKIKEERDLENSYKDPLFDEAKEKRGDETG